MLRYMKIENLAVIDTAELEVGDGFICLTGESGAGKSVIIDALLLLGGGRASSDLVRTGKDKAIVEAEFDISLPADETEYDLLDGEQLFLRREVTKDGKSRAFVNGSAVPKAVLQRYSALAFEIHGQHGQQGLMKERTHQTIFDAQTGLTEAGAAFDRQFSAFRKAWRHYWELRDGEAQRRRELDFIRQQIKEIKEINPNDEDRDLDFRLRQARNQESIRANRHDLHELLGRDLVPGLTRAKKLLDQLIEFDPQLEPYVEQIESLAYTLQDLHGDTLGDWMPDASLADLEQRENDLNRLFFKYGLNIGEVLDELARLEASAESLEADTAGLDGRWRDLERDYSALQKERGSIEKKRLAAAKTFSATIEGELHDLHLKGAGFVVEHLWDAWPERLSQDRDVDFAALKFRFLFSANPGEPAKALSKVASGGELSRVMLALIHSFERQQAVLLVFDEIDAGLGGETVHAVGEKLAGLGRDHQVMCVTHFAQVARFADQQIKLEKSVRDGRTFSSLVVCDHEQRVAELARLLGGDSSSSSLLDHARQLIGSGAP
ncbi:DNA repair protein RecN [Acanthopleuribacter pedis]|uniref:DNA repair protein RecN n=1 Tax=Acanthopleuribacter pedis TaxID=442870 RepID=A0A8J7QG34_9BACT|nr:DNA repair protein RecN [Acanthopleuribacter pedis]MBO1319766.1 DNA repair protein RecN [Acanthopleuribacter pedis]